MSIEVKIPAVGESITSGVVSVWHKKSGDFVNAGEPLFTLETDKVSTEITAEKTGLLETIVNEGQEVKIGEVVATIDDSKSAPAKKSELPSPQSSPSGRGGREAPVRESQPDAPLSPAVRRIVEEDGVDLAGVHGTGKDGRVTKGDLLTPAPTKTVGDAVSVPGKPTASPTEDRQSAAVRFTRRKMSPLRRKIAAQLVMAQHTAAILTTFNECDMSAVQELRTKTQAAFMKKNSGTLWHMSFFVKATVEGLKTVPAINGRIE